MSLLLLVLGLLLPRGEAPAQPLPSSGDVVVPVLVQKVDPEYPDAARRSYRTGSVLVQVTIDESGAVSAARVLKSTGEIFDAAALAAVKRWRYSPAKMGGEPVAVYFTVVIRFTLDLDGRVLDAGSDRVLVVFDRGSPELTPPIAGRVLRRPAGSPAGEPEPVGEVAIEKRATSDDRPTYEGRLTTGGPVRAGDVVRILLSTPPPRLGTPPPPPDQPLSSP
jgi:TonB family protein